MQEYANSARKEQFKVKLVGDEVDDQKKSLVHRVPSKLKI